MTRRLPPGKLVIATHNAGKLREIRALLAPYGMDCLSAGELGLTEPAETGTTFAENALVKAHASASASGLPALADDSGLCVSALGGAPGVYTADWAEAAPFEGGPGHEAGGHGQSRGRTGTAWTRYPRDCWFACVLALAWPDGREWCSKAARRHTHLAAARHARFWL